MGIKNIAGNVAKRGLKDILDKDVRKSYSEYKEIEENGLFLDVEDIIPYTEQLMYRLSRCSKCVDAGKCIGYETKGCSCDCPEKMLAPAAVCSEKRWLKIMEAAEWQAYKAEKGIQILAVQP